MRDDVESQLTTPKDPHRPSCFLFERKIMKKQTPNQYLKEIQLTPYSLRPVSRIKEPFTIAFVYSPNENVVIKGLADEVKKYINNHYPISVCNITHWDNGKTRGMWWSGEKVRIYFRPVQTKNNKYCIDDKCDFPNKTKIKSYKQYEIMGCKPNSQKIEHIATVRRIPTKWLKKYNQYIG